MNVKLVFLFEHQLHIHGVLGAPDLREQVILQAPAGA
jgi:hypothetical protein